MPSDPELIASAGRGDDAAFGEIAERHQAAVFRFLRSIGADGANAEDALQETFLGAWRGAAGFRGESSVRAWLFTIARNAMMRQHRRRVDEPAETESLSSLGDAAGWGSDDDPERDVIESEQRALFQRAMGRLSAADREILLLRDIEGLSGEEAAAVIGVPIAAMKTRLHRARLRLAANVRNEYARA
ncbi:MAG TPA: RNA polymerase sigma factor [Thermoanaerobaculia bacterium]